MALDVKAMNRNDQVVAGAGVAMLIVSFLPWYKASAFGFSVSANAWDLDFLGAKLAVILSVLAAAYVLARAAGVDTSAIPVKPRLLVLVLSALAVLMMIIQWTAAEDVPDGLDAGWSIGFYLALLLTIAQAVFAFLAFQQDGGMAATGTGLGTGAGTGLGGDAPGTGYAAPQPPAGAGFDEPPPPPQAGGAGYPPPSQ